MTTNGIFIRKYMDILYKNDFKLLISLDGNEKNNAYRMFKNGKPAYKNILENVKALQKKYPDYFSHHVEFNALLHNKNSVSDIYRFFKDYFGKKPYISSLNTSGIKESQKKEFWKTYANIEQSLHESEDYSLIEKDMLFKLPPVRDVKRFLYKYNEFCFINYNNLIYDDSSHEKIITGTCSPFSLRVFLTVNGKALPCERIGHEFSLGDVTPDGVELDFKKIEEKYNNYYRNLKTHCIKCHNAEYCGQCIFNIEKIEDENPPCNGFMTETDYKKFLSSYLNYCEEQPESFSKILKEDSRG
jgi:uncharacterized protein